MNLAIFADLYGVPEAQVERRVTDLLALFELSQRADDRVAGYSKGMKQRLALARALLHDPEIILFDEPTLGVDVQGRHALWEHIKAQQALGKTFVVSTNDMMEADALCDRLVIVDHGRAMALLCAGDVGTRDRLRPLPGARHIDTRRDSLAPQRGQLRQPRP